VKRLESLRIFCKESLDRPSGVMIAMLMESGQSLRDSLRHHRSFSFKRLGLALLKHQRLINHLARSEHFARTSHFA
jgi:hypothetical protein